jgi:hypothetical protein
MPKKASEKSEEKASAVRKKAASAATAKKTVKKKKAAKKAEPPAKRLSQLTPEDLQAHPVWELETPEEATPPENDSPIKPVAALPVESLASRVIGTAVVLRNGQTLPAMLTNIELADEAQTQRLLLVQVWHNGEWLRLARPFDPWFAKSGPRSFAKRLGLPVEEVFPMSYDISAHAQGSESVVKGKIKAPVRR